MLPLREIASPRACISSFFLSRCSNFNSIFCPNVLRILSWRDYRHFSRRKEGTRSSAVAASSPPLKSLASKSKASAAVVSDTLCFGTNCIRSSHQRCFSPQVLQCLPKKYLPNVPRASVGPEFVEIYLRRESKRGGDERRGEESS